MVPLVEIRLTNLPKSGGAMAPGTPGTPRDDTPDMMVWYIYQGMVELTTFFIDASVRLDVLFMFCVE